jgi:hypothetical protein
MVRKGGTNKDYSRVIYIELSISLILISLVSVEHEVKKFLG